MREGNGAFFVRGPLFAAANSGKGFVSFYEDVFNRDGIERRYIIKGGPGTGKSSFMRTVSEYAEKRGMAVEAYRCSSDPDSLDGIVIDGRIAMMDGTPPHSVEADCPGARDEWINLGAFWNADRLKERYSDVAFLSGKKGECYRRAYRALEAADSVYAMNRELILPAVQHEKMQKTVERLLEEIPNGDGFSVLPGLVSSLGMQGRVRFDSYERSAKRLYVIGDHYGSAGLFLRSVMREAQKKNCSLRVSYDPIHREVDALFFCQTGDCFVIGDPATTEQAHGTINMKRFVDRNALCDVRGRFRVYKKLYDELVATASESLASAGKYHFELERIYAVYMDFEAQNRFVRSFCQKIV